MQEFIRRQAGALKVWSRLSAKRVLEVRRGEK
jgi:hypothetical protein